MTKHKIDATAELLINRSPNDWAHIYDADYPTTGSDITGGISLPVPDLQRMARLWLMRKEIFAAWSRAISGCGAITIEDLPTDQKMRGFECQVLGSHMFVLKHPDHPELRVTYDARIAREKPDAQCAAVLNVASGELVQLAGMNSRLNGWSGDMPDQFYADGLIALRRLQEIIQRRLTTPK